jgi:uncharacterized OB-fold protein
VPDTNTGSLPPSPGAAFEAFLQAGELRLQICGACRRQIFFPRTVCPHCGSNSLEWRRASGRGIVYSTTIVRQRPDKGGDYNIALIELEEGARMLSRVQGIAPTAVRIGMSVEAEIAQVNGAPLVVFNPTNDRVTP